MARAIAAGVKADSAAEVLDESFDQVVDFVDVNGSIASLGLSDEHHLLRQTIREFAQREVRPRAQLIHRGDLDVPSEIITGLGELGVFGLSIPEEYGGLLSGAADHLAMLIATEELSAASLAVGGSLITRPEILVRALLGGGSEEQKRRWLPAIGRGEAMVAVAVTEPDFGSDVANIQCAAVRTAEDTWLVSGTKLWCTFAGRAHLLMLLCRTGSSEAGHRGLSLLVVEKPSFVGHDFEIRQPDGGTLIGRAIPTIGYRGLHTFELVFNRFAVPSRGLVGKEGGGFYLQMEGFTSGRLQTAARAVGVMEAAVRDTITFAGDRIIFGSRLIDMPLPRAILGRMIVRLQASRQLCYWAARRLDRGRGIIESSLAKLYASRMAEYVTRDATQLFGAMGYAEETDVSRYFVDARVLAIFEGAEEVLALRVIGKALGRSDTELAP